MPTPTLTLLSSMAAREVLAAMAESYTAATGLPVRTAAAGGVDVAKRVRAGGAADAVVLASEVIDQLIAEGRLAAGSRVDLVRSGIAVAVPTGASRPLVDSEDALMLAVLAATTLSYSTGPSGAYLEKMFARWGVLEQIRPRIVVPPPGVPVGSLIASGRVALGFQQASELMNLPGVDVLGPLPDSIQHLTTFSGGVSTDSAAMEGARALLEFMASPRVTAIKRMHAMLSTSA